MPDIFLKKQGRLNFGGAATPVGGKPDHSYFQVDIAPPGMTETDPLSIGDLKNELLTTEPDVGKKREKPKPPKLAPRYELVKLNNELYWAILTSRLPASGPADPFLNSGNKKRLVLGDQVGVPVGGDPDFAFFRCVVEPDTLDPNAPSVDDLTNQLKSTAVGKVRTKPLGQTGEQKDYELVVHDDTLLWRTPSPRVPTGPGYENPTRDWLFYEAIFNHQKFQKQNQQIEMGSYLIGLGKVKIFVCEGIEPAALKVLNEAFLPDLTAEELTARSAKDCPWKPQPTGPVLVGSASPPDLLGARGVASARTDVQVAMPFNFHDAGGDEHEFAIGGRTTSELGAPLVHLSHTWPMWKSASRSCVCRLTPIKSRGADWPAAKSPQGWTVHEGETHVTDLINLAKGSNYFKLGDDTQKQCFSVKTGVNFVGTVNQSGDNAGGKNRLETNSIDACIRSDLVTLLDTKAGHTQASDPHLLVLKELLSITEFNPDAPLKLGDGMQVRDLSVLDRNKKYICPISIMYLDRQMKKMTSRYAVAIAGGTPEQRDASKAWIEFWRDAYAVPLGRAKALLLLRYAMQMGSPNAQNYLIEFEDRSGLLEPTGRIVTRDLGDAQMHREVMWAFAGPEGEAPPLGGHPWTIDGGRTLEEAVIDQFYVDKASAHQPVLASLCTALERERELPPLSVTRANAREQTKALSAHLNKFAADWIRAKNDPDLQKLFEQLQQTLGPLPPPSAVTPQVVKQAARAVIAKPSAGPLRNLIDGSVERDVTAAQKAIAEKVTLPPVKYEFGVLREIKSYVMESGAVDPGRAYGDYSGVQMRWTMFSALTRGSNVASNSASTDQGIRDPGWQRVLELNAVWGQAHNRAFVKTIEDCLGLKITIPWGDAYEPGQYSTAGPGRYAALRDDEYNKAGEYYRADMQWEYLASSAIQNTLRSPEGQRAIREYHGRKWKPAPTRIV